MPIKKDSKCSNRLTVAKWAREWAVGSIKFAGEAPYKGMTPDQVAMVKQALVFYAESGAVAALQGLERHGNKITI